MLGRCGRGVGVEQVLAEVRRLLESALVAPPVVQAPHLTGRERQVLGLLWDGLDTQQVAVRLGISLHTARDHVTNLRVKFGVQTQLALVAAARKAGVFGCPCGRADLVGKPAEA
jgi:DNA-binding CsgD family transcriptional regulator